jgi:nucleoside-diphosphate-sugar epimerase
MSRVNRLSSTLVVGCGYVGRRIALALRTSERVLALTRSLDRATALNTEGVATQAYDLDADSTAGVLPQAATIFYLVPPPEAGVTDTRLACFLDGLPAAPTRFVYLSTTGVYGNHDGATVDEETPVTPQTDRARRRLDAEQQVTRWCERTGSTATILRVPGIYGPRRLPVERLRRGEPLIIHSESGLSNRIHVDDLVAACLLAARSPAAAGRVYNVTDGQSLSSTAYFELLADLSGLPRPRLVTRREAERVLSPSVWSFLAESRHVDSTRIRRELGFEPVYGDARAGIQASLDAESRPG